MSFVRGFYIQDSAPLKMEMWERVAVKGVRESGSSGVWITDLLQETAHTKVAALEIGFSLSLWGVDRPLLQGSMRAQSCVFFCFFPQLKASSKNSINIFSLILNPGQNILCKI